MSIEIGFFEEPKLQFGRYFEHEDAKTGLAEYGPFGKNVSGLHPSEIRLGFVGTRETISGAKSWVEECAQPIESENVRHLGGNRRIVDGLFQGEGDDPEILRYEKILNRDFVGFSMNSPFESCFQTNDRWDRYMTPRELESVLGLEDKAARILGLVELFESHVKSLATTGPTPDVIILALTSDIASRAHAVRLSGNFHLNFRRAIKASTMKWGIPIQLLKRKTVLGRARDLQERATRAWNFCTAQYYKADGVPWRPTSVDGDTCFVGISFYVSRDIHDKLTMRAAVAQAFDFLGQGFVLRGDPFEWDTEAMGLTPHLPRDGARKLIRDTLGEYLSVRGVPPRRVVIHKTSEFWGDEHPQFNEIEGLHDGISEVFSKCDTDFVALRQTGVRLFREGMYPPMRGTYFCVEGNQHFLYTMGFTPYLETYPGSYVPEPWQVTQHCGGSSPKDLLKDVLLLTKMNVNNCSFADGAPITVSFAQTIGEIMKHIPEAGVVQRRYKFYM